MTESSWVPEKCSNQCSCMLLTRWMPAYIPLKEICVPALQLLLPNLLSQATIDRLMASKNLFPGGSSRHILRLVLDVALLLWVRSQQVESNASYVRFTGADASPQCGYNWLLSNSVSLRVDMLPQLYGAAQRMIADCRQRTAVPDDVFEQSEQSISDHELIAQHVRQLHDVPVALGNAAACTGHKCAAMLHKWGLIVKERERLRSYTSSVFSFCSDMGTELGISRFIVSEVQSLLPEWLLPSTFESDIMAAEPVEPSPVAAVPEDVVLEDDLAGAGAAAVNPAPVEAQPQPEPAEQVRNAEDLLLGGPDGDCPFLPQAWIIPGMLHIVNNALVEVSGKLKYWDSWFEQLKEFEGLWNGGRLQRFVNYCVHGSDLQNRSHELLSHKLGSLYMKRWSEVVRFCRRLFDVLPIIRSCWDENKFQFMSGVSGGDEGQRKDSYQFSPNRLTVVLRDDLFFAYLDMVLRLAGMLEHLGNWAESCPCHEDVQLQGQAYSGADEAFRDFSKDAAIGMIAESLLISTNLLMFAPCEAGVCQNSWLMVSHQVLPSGVTCLPSSCCRRINICSAQSSGRSMLLISNPVSCVLSLNSVPSWIGLSGCHGSWLF